MNAKRIEWIDIFKSIAIILVVLGHTSGVFNGYIYLFHVPIFFLIVGYTEKFESESLIEIICKKFCSLLIPFYCINLFVILWRLYLNFINLEAVFYNDSITLDNFMFYLKGIVRTSWTTDIGGGSWFLPVLFIGIIISKVFLILEKKLSIYVPLVLSLFAFGFVHVLWNNHIYIPLKIDSGLLVSFYIILGRFFKKMEFEKMVKFNNKWWIILFAILYFGVFSHILSASINIANCELNTTVIDLLSVVFGYVLVINICNICQHLRWKDTLLYIGKNTLPLMLIHFAILRFIYIIEYYLRVSSIDTLKNLTPEPNKYSCFIYTFMVLIIFVFINKYFEKKRWYQVCLMGKWRFKVKQYPILELVLYFISITIILINIPYMQIFQLNSVGYTLDKAQIVQGYYEDGFLGKQSEFKMKTGKEGKLEISFYVTEFTMNNTVEIYIDDTFISSMELINGKNDISLNTDKNKIIDIKFVFIDTYIPAKVSNSLDERELSVILSDMEAR